MNTENLAKIFGPTVLGYSSADPDQHEIFAETMIQRDVCLTHHFIKHIPRRLVLISSLLI